MNKWIMVLATVVVSQSFAQKVAHLSLDSLVSMMPETKVAKQVAQDYLKSLENEVTMMSDEFQKKYTDYMAAGDKMSDLVRKTKEELELER